jgi:hypothetical protein
VNSLNPASLPASNRSTRVATSASRSAVVRALRIVAASSGRSARTTAERLAEVATRVDRLLAGNEAGLNEFTGPGLQELQQLLIDARETSLELRGLARDLRENPAQLIRERPQSGVEIKP